MALMRSRVAADPRNSRKGRRVSRRNGTRRRRLVPALQQLEPRHLLAFSAIVFADVNLFGVSSIPDSFVEFGDEVFFVANDGRTGSELWKSDGSEEGTALVADINPGPNGSLPSDLVVFGNDLFFTALDEDDEFDIWKSDGTTEGTVKVFDADAEGVYEIQQLTPSGERIFFTAFEFDSGYELWATDGTSSGTALVKDINLDQGISEPPRELTDVDGTLFFTSYSNGYDNRELWKSNGTAIGTVLVANVDEKPLESSSPRNLTNVGGTLYFAADDPDTGVELYKSGGTEATTVLVEDLNVGFVSSYPESLTEFGGQLFFTANDGTGRQLFKTNGTSITFVANTTPGASGSSAPNDLTVVGDELFFAANGGAVPGPITASQPDFSAANSFRSNSGNFAGLVAVKTSPYQGIVTTAGVSNSFTQVQQTGTSSDGPGWVAEGARIGDVGVGLSSIEVGDFILRDVDVPGDVSDPTWEWTIEDPAGLSNIEFAGFVSGNEYDEAAEALLFELFLNGSATRTSFLQVSGDDLDNWFADRDANNLALSHPGGETITSATVRMSLRVDGGPVTPPNAGNEALVLNASLTASGQSSGVAGRELYKFDGTTASLVKDIVTAGSSDPVELTESGGKLFFTANDPLGSGRELWVSDGTTEGTVLVQDIRGGFDLYGAPLDGNPRDLTNINGTLFFSVVDENNDREVWTSDGTADGTSLLKNNHTGTQDANIQQPVQVGSKLFFVADDGINGEAVWVVDLNSEDPPKIAADVTASARDRLKGLAKFGNGVIVPHDSCGIFTGDGVNAPGSVLVTTPTDCQGEGALVRVGG